MRSGVGTEAPQTVTIKMSELRTIRDELILFRDIGQPRLRKLWLYVAMLVQRVSREQINKEVV